MTTKKTLTRRKIAHVTHITPDPPAHKNNICRDLLCRQPATSVNAPEIVRVMVFNPSSRTSFQICVGSSCDLLHLFCPGSLGYGGKNRENEKTAHYHGFDVLLHQLITRTRHAELLVVKLSSRQVPANSTICGTSWSHPAFRQVHPRTSQDTSAQNCLFSQNLVLGSGSPLRDSVKRSEDSLLSGSLNQTHELPKKSRLTVGAVWWREAATPEAGHFPHFFFLLIVGSWLLSLTLLTYCVRTELLHV